MSFGKRFLELLKQMDANVPDMARETNRDASGFNHWKKKKDAPAGAIDLLAKYFIIPAPVLEQFFKDGAELPPGFRTPAQWRERRVARDAGVRLAAAQGQLAPPTAMELMLTLSRYPEKELREAFRYLPESEQAKLRAVLSRPAMVVTR